MTARLLTYRQAAELLACSPKTIARRVRSGSLPVVVDGGMRRIPERELDRYVAARTLCPARTPVTAGSGSRPTMKSLTPTLHDVPRVRRLWDDMGSTESRRGSRRFGIGSPARLGTWWIRSRLRRRCGLPRSCSQSLLSRCPAIAAWRVGYGVPWGYWQQPLLLQRSAGSGGTGHSPACHRR